MFVAGEDINTRHAQLLPYIVEERAYPVQRQLKHGQRYAKLPSPETRTLGRIKIDNEMVE
jgi:hypothetical protein